MVWAWLAACGMGLDGSLIDTASVGATDPAALQWSLQPISLALGETDVGQPVSGFLTLTNTGEADLQILDLGESPEEGLAVTLNGDLMLSPGSSAQLAVDWTPLSPGTLDTTLDIGLGASQAPPQQASVPVMGTALGAIATISTPSYDYGDVSIGCEGELTLTLTNTGNIAMAVDAIQLFGAEEFTADAATDLPWVLAPFQSHEQVVRFSPDDLGEMFAEVVFETDQGSVTSELEGMGVVDEERTLSFEAGEQNLSTMIWDVNLTAIPNSTEDQYSAFFVAALPTYFQTLLDNHAHFRAGFVWSVDGTVDGPYEYIDETFTAEEATDAALAMIAPGANGGDNDANFVTLQAAIAANQDWLFEDDMWAESKLNLITVQRDTEASGGLWSNYVAQAQAYKDDPENVVYHAIAGPPPSGCGSAEAFYDYDKAVTETGGVFLSVCAADWTDHMIELAGASLDGGASFFQLEGNPMASSIEVRVDGTLVTEGWEYDSSMNAVVFDLDANPSEGSTITIYYWMSEGCG